MTHSAPTTLEICRQLEQDIYRTRRALALYDWIATNADEIQTSTYGVPFSAIQQLCMPEIIAALGRIFDSDQFDRKPISIKLAITAFEADNSLELNPLLTFIAWASPNTRLDPNSEAQALRTRCFGVLKKVYPTPANNPHLKRIMETRHAEVSHRAQEEILNRAKWDDVDICLEWSERFVKMLRSSMHLSPPTTDIETQITAFRRLAHRAGIIVDPKLRAHEDLVAKLNRPPK